MTKLIIAALLLTLAALAAGCGQDSATATAVATTVPTTMPTATAAETSTMAGATPTAALATVTSDTGAAAEATASPVDTSGASLTPTAGAAATPPAAATGTSGNVNTGPAAAEWDAMFEKMRTLTSYHERAAISSGAAGASNSINVESDVIPPDRSYITATSTVSGTTTNTEIITVGQESWTKAGGAGLDSGWVKSPSAIPMGDMFNASNSGGFQNITQVGDDTIDGTAAIHYTLEANTTDQAGAPSTEKGEAWVAKDSGYLLRIRVKSSDTGANGEARNSDATISFSRFNDPTIKVEPPATTP